MMGSNLSLHARAAHTQLKVSTLSRTVPSSYSQPPCAQNADHLAQNTPNSPIFTEVVCVLGDSLPSAGRLEGLEGAGGTEGTGCGAHGRWQGLAAHRDDAPISDPAPQAWRAPEGPEGLAAAPMGGGGAWPGFEIDHSEPQARVWRSRGRATAHGAARPHSRAGARNTRGV